MSTAERNALPMRRECETFEFTFGGSKYAHVITLGAYSNGEVGEIFVKSGKSGETLQLLADDAARLVSVALQYGCPVTVLKHLVDRDEHGKPLSIIGAAIDCLPNAPEVSS